MPGLGMEILICEEHGWPGGAECLTATHFKDYNALAVHQVWCAKSSFTVPGKAVGSPCG